MDRLPYDVTCIDPFCTNKRRHLASSGKCRRAAAPSAEREAICKEMVAVEVGGRLTAQKKSTASVAVSPSDPRWPANFASLKAQYPGALLLFRIGDFYELFFADAERAAKLFNLTITGRRVGPEQSPMTMCGFPHNSLEVHLKTLVAAGERVAICELDEATSTSKAKGA